MRAYKPPSRMQKKPAYQGQAMLLLLLLVLLVSLECGLLRVRHLVLGELVSRLVVALRISEEEAWQ